MISDRPFVNNAAFGAYAETATSLEYPGTTRIAPCSRCCRPCSADPVGAHDRADRHRTM